jgi:hypothetical protein
MSRRYFLIAMGFAALFPITGNLQAQDAATPATLAEIRDAIDWSKMPKPPGAQAGRTGLATSSYKAIGTFSDAATFFRKSLPELGWKEDTTAIPGVDQKDYLYLTFDKGDMRLSINGYRAEPGGPMSIIVTNNGNADIRTFPKPADAQFRSNGKVAAFFTTGSKPEDAAEFCRKGILERGWKEVPDASAKALAKEGRIILRFLKNAMELSVVASKNMAGQTEVSISSHVRYKLEASEIRKALTSAEIPSPASEPEYLAVLDLRNFPLLKDARKRERQTQAMTLSNVVTCQAPGKLEEAIDFYRREFLSRGWKETLFDHEIDDRVELDFQKQGYLVSVRMGQRKNEDVQVSVVNHGNVDPRQLPFPPDAEIAPERGFNATASTSLSETEAAQFYHKELTGQGWKESKARGHGVYQFQKNATRLQIEIQKDNNGTTTVKLSPNLFTAVK